MVGTNKDGFCLYQARHAMDKTAVDKTIVELYILL